jgi:hypothetical protein
VGISECYIGKNRFFGGEGGGNSWIASTWQIEKKVKKSGL